MDYGMEEAKNAAASLRDYDLKANLECQIQSLEKRLTDLKELKNIMENDPTLTRALEIMRRTGGLY